MKKIILSLFLLVFFGLPTFVSAQAESQRWVCLDAERCDKSEYCDLHFGNQGPTHIGFLKLPTGTTLLKSSKTYIIECIATDGGQICTSGNSTTDNTVFGQDNYSTLKNTIGYEFVFLKKASDQTDISNPFTSNSDGTMDPLAWRDYSPASQDREWLALNFIAPEPTTATSTSSSGTVGALQQGTFAFNIAEAIGAGSDESCVTLRWDPYGRVFDAQTLEPVFGSSVNLSIKRSSGSFTQVTTGDVPGGNIINPQTVLEDGMFSFVVPDGTYKLSVTKAGYTFPVADISKLHTNYSRIYSDIYPASYANDEIVQAGGIQHRDIPILATGQSLSSTPKMMEYIQTADVIQGRVSHPFAVITAYSVKPSISDPKITTRYRQLKQVKADKNGNFHLTIDASAFEETESFGEFEITKTDLKTLTTNPLYQKIISFFTGLINKVEAADTAKSTTTFKFDPIPIYLEGYAYDGGGQVLPNATVSIYLSYSSKPYYQTKSDEKGYFKISSENLPKVPYKIKYTSATGVIITTTTTQFIGQNEKYLTENNINLNTFKNSNGKELSKKDLKATINPTGFFKKETGTNMGGTTSQTNLTNKSSMLMVIGVLIFLIIAAAIILGVYLIKKKQSQTPIPPNL